MTVRRLALLASRFWPNWSEGGQALGLLAEELIRLGHEVRVVTPCWEAHWPDKFVIRDVPVVRLPYPQPHWWGSLRYMQHLLQWLQAEASSLDGVIVSGLRYEAWCACRVLPKSGVKILLREETSGDESDLNWHEQAMLGGRIREACGHCTAFIAPTQEIQHALRETYATVPVHYIPNGVPKTNDGRDDATRQMARNALREVNHDLTLDDRSPLVVSLGRFERSSGLEDLALAWREVIARWPLARLWMIGDGPQRDELWELVTDLDLRYRLCLPGTFDDWQDIFAAAQVVVVPTRSGGPSQSLVQALAAGLPVVATDVPANREALGNAGMLVAPNSPAELSTAILALLENQALADALGTAGRERVAATNSVEKMALAHLQLLED